MQAGFAMLCAGAVQAKNVKNIMLKNFLDTCASAIAYFMTGYAFSFGIPDDGTTTTFIGRSNFFLRDMASGRDYVHFFFQFGFAANAATIVCCSIAERSKFVSYLCHSTVMSAFVYPIVARSIWNPSGFLSPSNAHPFLDTGVIDYAGSGVVHLMGGTTAWIGAVILGPRIGKFFDEHGNELHEPGQFRAHSSSLEMLGTFVLWFGWYVFDKRISILCTRKKDSRMVEFLPSKIQKN